MPAQLYKILITCLFIALLFVKCIEVCIVGAQTSQIKNCPRGPVELIMEKEEPREKI